MRMLTKEWESFSRLSPTQGGNFHNRWDFFQYQWENVQRMGKYVANNRKVPSQYPANNGKATKKGNLTSNIEMRLDNDTWGCLPAVLLDSKQLYCDRIL
jgi:hypothetical protein